ncbi:MAG: GNAT family N-acetyltransferase [Hyphomicrobiales bacterium]
MTPNSYSIRPATDADGTEIAALIAGVFGEYENCPFVDDEFPELKAVGGHYRKTGGEIWVANSDNGSVFGCLALVPSCVEGMFELFKVYVAKEARGTGLAQSLLDTGLLWGQARGLNSLRLWTDTRFASGHRFYEKLGFTKQPVIRYLGDAAESWEYLYLCNNPDLATKAPFDRNNT